MGERKPNGNWGETEAAADRRKEAFELRKRKMPYRKIAEVLDVSVSTAFSYVEEYWKELEAATKETAEQVRNQELETLDELEARWAPLALHEGLNVSKLIEGPDGEVKHIRLEDYDAGLKAVDRLLKIHERRSKLLGLDAAQKVEGEIKHTHMTLEEFEKRVKEAEE